MSIKVNLNVNDIGPHSDAKSISESKGMNNLKIAIYAQNGSGKTFISRMFALSEDLDDTNDYSHLLTLNKNSGSFLYTITDDKNNKPHKYSVIIRNGFPVQVNNSSGYIYHVFNSDYVRKNINSQNFVIDGDNITGVIIGETNIDLSNEKQLLSTHQAEIDRNISEIKGCILKAKQMLSKNHVKSNTSEYNNINYKNVVAKKYTSEKDSVELITNELNKIESIPDDIHIVSKIPKNIDVDFLSEIEKLLNTSYNRMNLDEKVMNKIRTHFDFYKDGLFEYENSNENICPFCNQYIQEDGIYYINLYRQFFNNEEAQIINEIEERISVLNRLKKQIIDFYNDYYKMQSWFYEYRVYVPDFAEESLIDLTPHEEVINSINSIIDCLYDKKANISNNNYNVSVNISTINNLKNSYYSRFNDSLILIEKLESILTDSRKKKLEIKKKLCRAVMNQVITSCEPQIDIIEEQRKLQTELENKIEEMESDVKSDKRKLVIKSMKQFLAFFFHEKYEFNEDRFMLEFKSHLIDSNANNILSDGEKSIIAFCYYLATTHTLLSRDNDYEKLYFIIDDPISSLDYDYVYAVTGIIKNLNVYFPKIKRERYIILTHNAEFMASLMANRITSNNFYLKNGKITEINDELLMPYEYHLMDVYNISIGKSQPSHTTANSVRHVLETIMRFDDPKSNNNILLYINNDEILRKNRFLYSFMNDLSHGRYRIEKAITDEEIISICKTVCEFVDNKFSKQLDAIKAKKDAG